MKTKLLLLGALVPFLTASLQTATAAVSIPPGGVTVDFAAVPSGADFASVSVAGAVGDLTVLGAAGTGIDNPTTGISATLAWPAAATDWAAAANTIAAEPTAAQNLNAQVRYVTGTQKMLTGTTGNRYSALIGRFQNNTGGAIASLDLSWTVGTPFDAAGTGLDALNGIHVYFSTAGLAGSWTRLNGPFTADGPTPPGTIAIAGNLADTAELYIAWIDDNGTASNTSPNFEGHYTIDDVVFSNIVDPNTPALHATVEAGVLKNQSTDTIADDTIEAPITIIPVNLGASTGWNSNLVAPDSPASGLYSAANPVTFTIAATSAPKTVILSDALDPSKTVSVSITAPGRTFTAALAAVPNIVRNENNPGVADDTVSFDITVSGANGGPHFAVAVEPGTAIAGSYDINAAATTIPVTLSAVPALAGTVYFRIWDVSYPASSANIAVAVPAPTVAPTQYVVGKQNFAGGLTNVLSLSGDALPAQWMNYAGIPALVMHNGGTLATVRSEILDLSAVGAVSVSARIRLVDTSSGFEDPDTFTAVLILDGDTVNPVSLTDAIDLDNPKNGLEGAELVVAGGTLVNPTITNHNLSYIIPAGVSNAQLVVTTLNNSANESLTLDSVLFSSGPVTSDSDGDGVSDADEVIMGTSPNDPNDVMRLTQSPGNPNQISFPTVNGRFYRVYVSDDANDASHLQVWKDAGLGTFPGNGAPATFNVTVAAGESRRFYRVHVMQTDGPLSDGVWPATWP